MASQGGPPGSHLGWGRGCLVREQVRMRTGPQEVVGNGGREVVPVSPLWPQFTLRCLPRRGSGSSRPCRTSPPGWRSPPLGARPAPAHTCPAPPWSTSVGAKAECQLSPAAPPCHPHGLVPALCTPLQETPGIGSVCPPPETAAQTRVPLHSPECPPRAPARTQTPPEASAKRQDSPAGRSAAQSLRAAVRPDANLPGDGGSRPAQAPPTGRSPGPAHRPAQAPPTGRSPGLRCAHSTGPPAGHQRCPNAPCSVAFASRWEASLRTEAGQPLSSLATCLGNCSVAG